mgnify:CR=1 FL=1
MIEEILLLTDAALAPSLEAVLVEVNPDLRITRIHSLQHLKQRCLLPLSGVRMLSFGSDVIVPEEILQQLDCTAYNFHPGPPNYPGRYPSCFFIYEGETLFGSTVHEMISKVDSGPINAVEWFQPPTNIDRFTLDTMSFRSLFGMFKSLAPHLAIRKTSLKRIAQIWGERKYTQKDFDALCRLPANVNEEEFKRRYRAIGEGPEHAMEIMIYGHRFQINNDRDERRLMVGGYPVVRAEASKKG